MQRNCILYKIASWGAVGGSCEALDLCERQLVKCFFPNSNQALLTPLTPESLHLLFLPCLLCPSNGPWLWALGLRTDPCLFLQSTVFSQFLSPWSNHPHSISSLCQLRPIGTQRSPGSQQKHEYPVQGQERVNPSFPALSLHHPSPRPLQSPNNPKYLPSPQSWQPWPLRTLH